MSTHYLFAKPVLRKLILTTISSLFLLGLYVSDTQAMHLNDPWLAPGDGDRTIKVARVQTIVLPNGTSSYCVKSLVGTYGLEQFTRIMLSTEINNSWESPNGMKAFSLIIRGLGVYHDKNPLRQYGFCNGVIPFDYDVTDPNHIAFTPFKSSAHEVDGGKGNVGNKPNDRATDTMSTYMQSQTTSGVSIPLYFNDCIQGMINAKASTEPNIETVIRSVFSNTGSCGTVPPCNDNHRCEYDYNSGWRIETYPVNYVKSMTNGVAVSTPPYSSRTTNTIVVNQVRQAEQFWGNDMGHGLASPFGQPGTYIIGVMHAQLVEYLAYYPSPVAYSLCVNAISDIPQPVAANIYIDGKYWGWLDWNHNDNSRHIDCAPLPALSPGHHALAIQFRLAAWTGSGDNGTRWLYLDDLGIIP